MSDSSTSRSRITCVGGPIHGREIEDAGPYYKVPVRDATPMPLGIDGSTPIPYGNRPLACHYMRHVVEDVAIYEHSCSPVHCPASRIDPFDHDTWITGLRAGATYARDRMAECGHLLAETRGGCCRACEREDRIRCKFAAEVSLLCGEILPDGYALAMRHHIDTILHPAIASHPGDD